MSGVQRPLTTEEQLNLGLITEHDTPGSPHREHMGGSKQPPQLPESTGEMSPKEMRHEAKALLPTIPRHIRDQFVDDFQGAEEAADSGNPKEMQAVLEAWKADPEAAFRNKELRGVKPGGPTATPEAWQGPKPPSAGGYQGSSRMTPESDPPTDSDKRRESGMEGRGGKHGVRSR